MERNKQCNHNPSDPNTSLIFSRKKTMTIPEQVNCICSVCYNNFSFFKENGIYHKIE